MILEGVVIRNNAKMQMMDKLLLDGLELLTLKKSEVPLVYTYLHNPNKEFIIDGDNKIGKVFNIRKTKNGIVGDVELLSILKLASNYTGVIDNMMAEINPHTKKIEIKAFIIYDKIAKEDIVRKRNQSLDTLNQRLAKPGEIPFVSSYDNFDLSKINDELVKEYQKLMEPQNNNEELKEGMSNERK